MILNNQRRELNNLVKEWGNKKHNLKLLYGKSYGLGDFLTQEVNFRKAGAVAGFLAPGFLMYSLAPEGIAAKMVYSLAPYISVVPVAMTATLGFRVGMFLDDMMGILPESYKPLDPSRMTQPKPL